MDPLDSPDFDPIAYINQKFPTEASLDGLDSFAASIDSQIFYLDEELSHAIQTQSIAGVQATQDITEAQESIVELVDKIADIKLQASQSEKMVQEICADIKRLDCAKTHLQSTITSLKRLQMLLAAVSQLEGLVNELQYKDTANLLDAIKQLMTRFQKYTGIPVITELNSRVSSLQMQLKKHIHRAFQDIGQLVESTADAEAFTADLPGNMKSLSESCLVVDALGLDARKDLLDEFIRLQLNPYEKLFGPNGSHHALEHTDRRWAWFKRLYKHVDSKFSSIFPNYWNVPFRLAMEFIARSKVHLVSALTLDSSSDTSDVQVLIQSLQSTLKFEADLRSKFEEVAAAQPKLRTMAQVFGENPGAGANNNGGGGRKVSRRTSIIDTTYNINSISSADTDSNSKVCDVSIDLELITASVSCEFDRFLGPYVLVERQNLEDMLRRLEVEEDQTRENETSRNSSDGSAPVYGSSMNMFAFIKGSIKRCTALTNGQTFLSLCKEFKTCLQQYNESLRGRCPIAQMASGTPVYKLQPGDEVTLCFLINTAEYCSEVVPQLESLIQSKMLEKYADRVDFSQEVDTFLDLVAHIVKVLVSGVMERLEGSFREMNAAPWSTMVEAGEDSPYIHMVQKHLQELSPKLRSNLSSSYFKNICSKIGTEVCQRLLDIITKQKKISDAASQQLLLDCHIVKTILLQLPIYGAEEGSSLTVTSMYTKLINSKMGHIEALLKLVATPEDMLGERFHVMWPTGLASDLQMIMNLKGVVRRQDQQKILDSVTVGTGGAGASSVGVGAGASTSKSTGVSMLHGVSDSLTSSVSSSYSAASSSSASMMNSLTLSARSAVRGFGSLGGGGNK